MLKNQTFNLLERYLYYHFLCFLDNFHMVEPFRMCGMFYKIKLSKKGSPPKYAYPRVFLKSKHIGQI